MLEIPHVYIGFDSREEEAWRVAYHSLHYHARWPVRATALRSDVLQRQEILLRPYRIYRGGIWDVISDAPQSTEFAASRFMVPFLAHEGWALFVDCDVVFLADVAELFDLADPAFAVQVVQHAPQVWPAGTRKMDGQLQVAYARKNWSSVMLFNCDHPGNRRLTHSMVNRLPGRDLHRFCWLEDSEIGTLAPCWNWLVGVEPRPEQPKIAHFTLGGPWLPDWEPKEHDSLWLDAQAHSRAGDRAANAR